MFSSIEWGPNAPMTAVFLYVSKKAINELSTTNIEPDGSLSLKKLIVLEQLIMVETNSRI